MNVTFLTNEDRIALEEQISSVSGSGVAIPSYVISEAKTVIDKIAAAQSGRTFTLAAITDLHYGNSDYTAGVEHAAQALKYIDERIKLDAVAVLGDFTDGHTGREGEYENAIADFRAVNAVLNNLRFAPNLRIHGNHDFYEGHMPEILRYTSAYSEDVVWGSKNGDYYYKDFNNHKLRIICLSLAGVDDSEADYTDEQAQWFANTLDISDKSDASDWQILVLSHQPVDYWRLEGCEYHLGHIIDAYYNGTSYSNGSISCNFAGKNAATLIGNIHGHIHNLLVDRIYVGGSWNGVQTEILRIATPEACFGRPNTYSGTEFGESTTYNKSKDSAKDTSFVIYCIDLDTNTIKAICYGAGYDRTITYGDSLSNTPDIDDDVVIDAINQIPIATDAEGNVVTNGAMYTGKRWNSSGEVVDASEFFITGFIPAEIGDLIQIRWNNTVGINDGYQAIRSFDENKNPLTTTRLPFKYLADPTDEWDGAIITSAEGFVDDRANGALDFTLCSTANISSQTKYIAFVLAGSPSEAAVYVKGGN